MVLWFLVSSALPIRSTADLLTTHDPEEIEKENEKETSIYEKHDALLHGSKRRTWVCAIFVELHFALCLARGIRKRISFSQVLYNSENGAFYIPYKLYSQNVPPSHGAKKDCSLHLSQSAKGWCVRKVSYCQKFLEIVRFRCVTLYWGSFFFS